MIPDCQQCDDSHTCPFCPNLYGGVPHPLNDCTSCKGTGRCTRCSARPELRGRAKEPGVFETTQASLARAMAYWAGFGGSPELPGLELFDYTAWLDGEAPELGEVAVEGSPLQALLADRKEER